MSLIRSNLITNNEIASKCVEHQPDRLTGSPNENKRVFDEFPKLIATKFNNTIETLDSIVDSQSGSIEDNKSVINVLSARMDEFESLPDGSTSGDAELIDVRVGADGTTYANAGDAVRGQASGLKSNISNIKFGNIQKYNDIYYRRSDVEFEQGSFNSSGWQNEGTPTYEYYVRTKYPHTFGKRILVLNPKNATINIYSLKNDAYHATVVNGNTNSIITFDTNEGTYKYLIRATNSGNKTNVDTAIVGIYELDTSINELPKLIDNSKKYISVDPIGNMVATAETYFNVAYDHNDLLVYESRTGLYGENVVNGNGDKAIVCSMFVLACLTGTTYENSRYVLGAEADNIPSWWGFVSDGSGNYSYKDYMKVVDFAEYLDNKGLLNVIDKSDISTRQPIKAGDILFWLTEDGSEDNHIAICLYATEDRVTFMQSSHGTRDYDGANCGVFVNRPTITSENAPTRYARLPLIPTKYTSELIFEDDTEHTGTYTSQALLASIPLSLNRGFYTLEVDDEGDSPSIYTNEKYVNSENTTISKQTTCFRGYGKFHHVFYVQNPTVSFSIYLSGGTTYDVKRIRLFKGYHL